MPVHTNLAVALLAKGQTAEGIREFEKTLEISPKSVPVLNNLAWTLATHTDPVFRDSKRALDLAQQANELSGGKDPLTLRTLAAAYANAGQFDRAVEIGHLAQSLADGQSTLGKSLQWEVSGYEARLPYREKR